MTNLLHDVSVAPAPPPAPSAVDALAVRWRSALDAAERALDAGYGSFPASELGLRSAALAAERADVLRLLRVLARDEGVGGQLLHLTRRRDEKRLLGLPADVAGCVFDLEGVLVGSVVLHVAAWTQVFDEFCLASRSSSGGEVERFDPRRDYPVYLAGRPRLEGVHAFLLSRGIRLPEGRPDDAPGVDTVHALSNRKNQLLQRRLDTLGVAAYAGSWQYLEAAHEAGLRTAVVSASAHTKIILERSGLAGVVDESIAGETILAEHLRDVPAPDRLLAACRHLGVEPEQAAAFETTPAGIVAAHAGHFRFTVAIDQSGQEAALRREGADLVVRDLADVLERRLPV